MTIWRGEGGGGDATTDSEINFITSLTNSIVADTALTTANAAASAASALAAATSESNAAASEIAAASSASAASASAISADASANSAANSYDSFDDRYLGSKTVAPTLDNDGNALLVGALYWNSVTTKLFVWSGTTWRDGFFTGLSSSLVTATAGQTVVTTPSYTQNTNTIQVYVNGLKVISGTDFIETSNTSITFSSGLTLGDEVEIVIVQSVSIGTTLASNVSYTPTGTIAAANVQDALSELSSEKVQSTVLAASGGASLVGNTPSGTIAATTVQGAINEIVSDLTASTGSSLVGYLPSGTGAVATTIQTKLRESVSVKDFGAVGDGVADDTAAIQAAINYAQTYAGGATVIFPDGNYRTTSELLISNSYVHLVGENNIPAVSTSSVIGASIRFDSASGGNIIRIEKTGSGIYGVVLRSLGIRATSTAASNKPNAVFVKESSEIVIDECYIKDNLSAGIVFNGCAINRVVGGAITSSQYGIVLDADGTSVFNTAAIVTLQNINFYENSSASVFVKGSTDTVWINNCWSEFAPYFLDIAQQVGKDLIVENIQINGCYFFNGTTSPYKASHLVRSTAQNTASFALVLEQLLIKNTKVWSFNDNTSNATEAVVLLRNGNSNGATRNRGVIVEDSIFYGLNSVTSAAVVWSNGSTDSGIFRGRNVALTGYQTGSSVALISGSGSWVRESFDATPYLISNGFRFTNSATAQAQTLDYYDEGTWTATDDSGASLLFSDVAGNCRYTRIGNLVTCTFSVTYPTTASGATTKLAGLPFTSAATTNSVAGGCVTYTDAGINFSLLVDSNAATFGFKTNAGAGVTNLTLSGKRVRGVITYLVA